jgi:hypothetical protein
MADAATTPIRSARVLEDLDHRIETNLRQVTPMSEDSFGHLERKVLACCAKEEQPVAEGRVRALINDFAPWNRRLNGLSSRRDNNGD